MLQPPVWVGWDNYVKLLFMTTYFDYDKEHVPVCGYYRAVSYFLFDLGMVH